MSLSRPPHSLFSFMRVVIGKFIEKNARKERSEPSSSGESSTSPDAKKSKSVDFLKSPLFDFREVKTSLKSKNTRPTTKSSQL